MKSFVQNFICIFSTTFFLVGCFDSKLTNFDNCTADCIVVQGIATYEQNGNPITNSKIEVFVDRRGITSVLDPEDNLGSVITDQDGSFTFEVPWLALVEDNIDEINVRVLDYVVPDSRSTVKFPVARDDIGKTISVELSPYEPCLLKIKFLAGGPLDTLGKVKIDVRYLDRGYNAKDFQDSLSANGTEIFKTVQLPLEVPCELTVAYRVDSENEERELLSIPNPSHQNDIQTIVY